MSIIGKILRKNKILWNIIKKIRSLFYVLENLNIPKTLYVNFKTQKFKDAVKFPVWIYGKMRISNLSGQLIFGCKIKTGTIIIGKNTDFFSNRNRSLLSLSGIWHCNGLFQASNGVTITIDGTIETGNLVSLGSGAKIRCYGYTEIGDGCGIVEESQVFDTNFHCIINLKDRTVASPVGRVIIGKLNWIGNRSTIMKGTVLPDFSIVASYSLVSKDFSAHKYPTIGGVPAKILTEGQIRVYDLNEESRVFLHYRTHKTETYISTYDTSVENSLKHRAKVFKISKYKYI